MERDSRRDERAGRMRDKEKWSESDKRQKNERENACYEKKDKERR